ncbi:MAG: alpha/beta hydrolase domain-containing protein [Lacisediminihabitans sp.]
MVIDLSLSVNVIDPHRGRGPFLSPASWRTDVHPALEDCGYKVQEFSVSGHARVFREGELPDAHDRRGAYTTRVLAIRPSSDAAFSGVVHIELINPSAGEDFPMFWPDAGFHLMERGDAYLGVTCKAVTVDDLRTRDPERYSGLRIAHDSIIWDLLGAVARSCHEAGSGGLLPGLRAPQNRLATGWSQSGGFLRTYIAERIHQEHSAQLPVSHGSDEILDGYLIGVASGGFGPHGYIELARDGEIEFDQKFRPKTLNPAQVPMTDARRIMLEPPVPVIEYMSEDEAVQHVWHRRPDSDCPGDRYRCYQVPGRGHETGLLSDADRADELGLAPGEVPTSEPPIRHDSSRWLIASTIDHLVAWVNGGAPPRADPIRVDVERGRLQDPAGIDYSQVTVPLDHNGYAMGGLRHLDADVPTASVETDPQGPLVMRRWVRTPFTTEKIAMMYGDREHFRRVVTARAEILVADGWLLAGHREAAIEGAIARFDLDFAAG